MVKSLSLSRKESKATQRILSIVLLFVLPLLLAVFPELYITIVPPSWGTLDQKPPLPFIHQRVSKENGACRFNSEKRERTEFEEFALGEEEFRSENFHPLISKSGFITDKFWLELTTHAGLSYQVTHLNSLAQPRAPPYIP